MLASRRPLNLASIKRGDVAAIMQLEAFLHVCHLCV